MINKIKKLYETLYKKFGPQGWWPIVDINKNKSIYRKGYFDRLKDEEMFEIAIGAILTQNTTWKNAEKGLLSLKKNGLLSHTKILNLNDSSLYRLIRSTGYYKQKTKKVKNFSLWLLNNGGSLSKIFLKFRNKKDELRNLLLKINGVGKETADSILLYAGYFSFFVIDSYTKRFYKRFSGDINEYDYDELRIIFEKSLNKDFKTYMEFHALIIELSKNICLKKNPLCLNCPLSRICKKEIG